MLQSPQSFDHQAHRAAHSPHDHHFTLRWLLSGIPFVLALAVQFGGWAWFGGKLDQRLAGVESGIHDLRPIVDETSKKADAAAMHIQMFESQLTDLRGRVDEHDSSLSAIARIEERLTAQQRQLDRLEVLIERRPT